MGKFIHLCWRFPMPSLVRPSPVSSNKSTINIATPLFDIASDPSLSLFISFRFPRDTRVHRHPWRPSCAPRRHRRPHPRPNPHESATQANNTGATFKEVFQHHFPPLPKENKKNSYKNSPQSLCTSNRPHGTGRKLSAMRGQSYIMFLPA